MLEPWSLVGKFIAGAVTVIPGLYYGWRWLVPRYTGWRDNRAAIKSAILMLPQVVESYRRWLPLEQTILGIAAEVRPNGGGSLRDVCNRLERRADELAHGMLVLADTMRVHQELTAEVGMFECTPDGRNVMVNGVYRGWLKCSEKDLLDFNFLSFVSEEDREDVAREWESARKYARTYHKRHSMVATDNERIFVDVTATPVPTHGTPVRWIGVIRRLSMPYKD